MEKNNDEIFWNSSESQSHGKFDLYSTLGIFLPSSPMQAFWKFDY
jgi:hypothetical protein